MFSVFSGTMQSMRISRTGQRTEPERAPASASIVSGARRGAAAAVAAVVASAGLAAGCVGPWGAEGADGACAGRTVTLRGTSARDHLRGTPGNDVIWADAGNDVVAGLGGDDVLCGGPGADRLIGGEGNDVIDGGEDERVTVDTDSYDWNGDVLAGGPGDDTLVTGPDAPPSAGTGGGHRPVDEVTYASSSAPVTADLARGRATGEGRDRFRGPVAILVGSSHDDVLRGSDRAERILGGPGGDHLDGRGGNDQLDAAGSPRLDATGAEPHESTPNTLLGGPGDDEIQGSRGDDDLDGGPGADALYGDLGADRSLGGEGQDTVNDYVVAASAPGARRQLLSGGTGRDRLGSLLLARPASGTDAGPEPGDPVYDDGTGSIDLAAGTARGRTTGPAAVFSVGVPGFEDVETPVGTWTVFGTEGPNDIVATDEQHPVTIHARGGDDHLAGSFTDDLLDGGPGRDVAFGYVGQDRYVHVEKIGR